MQFIWLICIAFNLYIVNAYTAYNFDFEETELWLEQKLDHFNDSDARTFQMRYLVSDSYYKLGQPIFIIVNGEWAMENKTKLNGYVYEMIKGFNGYLIETEHRYFGKTQPFSIYTAETLQYLSMQQALADLAHFIKYKKSHVPALAKSKVFLIGCSYAAGLVVHMRKFYPDLVDGAWSSCGGFNFRLDNSDNFISVGNALRKIGGDICYEGVSNFSHAYEKHKQFNDAVYKQLEAKNLTVHFNNTPSIIMVNVQHRNTTTIAKLCQNITALHQSADLFGYGQLLAKLQSQIPDAGKKTDIKATLHSSYRQWLWLCCNGIGNFLSTSSMMQPFANLEPWAHSIKDCKKEFGATYTIDYVQAQIEQATKYFGGLEPNVEHVIYTKSQYDPWRFAGIPDECAVIMPDVGHCHEMRTRKENDFPGLIATREKIVEAFRIWNGGEGSTRETQMKC
ncbi:putative serine protease K12H4.7 [Drosophila busckii]|uniref:putative serine protease K12H4.7 n=1 Tax=Drosophila busckii TaxID=30019 RepID=UPI00083F0260|nr:putative serine protease K12H4.7 [Drosophila busckii]